MLSYLYLCFTQSGFWVLFFSGVCWKPGAKLCGCHTVFHLNIHASQIHLFFFINLSTKIIWYIICLFLCWQLKSCSLKQNVHENKVFLFNIFRLAFSLSSLFWYMYIIIISPFHLSVHIIMVMQSCWNLFPVCQDNRSGRYGQCVRPIKHLPDLHIFYNFNWITHILAKSIKWFVYSFKWYLGILKVSTTHFVWHVEIYIQYNRLVYEINKDTKFA